MSHSKKSHTNATTTQNKQTIQHHTLDHTQNTQTHLNKKATHRHATALNKQQNDADQTTSHNNSQSQHTDTVNKHKPHKPHTHKHYFLHNNNRQSNTAQYITQTTQINKHNTQTQHRTSSIPYNITP